MKSEISPEWVAVVKGEQIIVWDYKSEAPWMESLLRSEVRKVAPGAYCKPLHAGGFRVFDVPEFSVWNETEVGAWANALIANCGLPEVKQP